MSVLANAGCVHQCYRQVSAVREGAEKYLDIDAGLIHGLNASFAHVFQLLSHETAGAGSNAPKVGHHIRVVIMLLNGDDALVVENTHKCLILITIDVERRPQFQACLAYTALRRTQQNMLSHSQPPLPFLSSQKCSRT